MVVDSFIFFAELDLLEVRLNVLSPYVDKFLLVESETTFQGNPKPLYYWENRHRFSKFTDRIIHVVPGMADGRTYDDGWSREHASRDAIRHGLVGLPDDTILLLSDLDEIPNLSGWDSNAEVPAVWSHTLFYYYVDLRISGGIKGTVAVPLGMFRNNPLILDSGHKLREFRHYSVGRVLSGERGGWHFSYLGGPEAIRRKIQAFAHAELLSHATIENIKFSTRERWRAGVDLFNRSIYQFELLPDDSHLPDYLVRNKQKYPGFWHDSELTIG